MENEQTPAPADLPPRPYEERHSTPKGAHAFIQWKGTNVCLDFRCACGAYGHFDGDFAYHFRCEACERVFATDWYVKMIELRPSEVAELDKNSIKIATDDDAYEPADAEAEGDYDLRNKRDLFDRVTEVARLLEKEGLDAFPKIAVAQHEMGTLLAVVHLRRQFGATEADANEGEITEKVRAELQLRSVLRTKRHP